MLEKVEVEMVEVETMEVEMVEVEIMEVEMVEVEIMEVEMVEVEMAEVEMVEAVKVATKKPTSSSRTSKRLTHLPLPFPLATRSLGNDERK